MAVHLVGAPSPVLRGREVERAVLDELLESLRAERSAALVLRSEAGFGKTALLEYVAVRARDCRVIRAAGVEAELELPFAAVHQLCLPLLDGLPQLPKPQRDAFEAAFGLSAGPQPELLPVALAVLGLVTNAAATEPLVCLVDDAQWLDRSSAQVLSFVARRLQAESVLMLFAERDDERREELAGLPELRLAPLADTDARELFASAQSAPLDERVLNRIVAEARGNPLALLELSHEVMASGFSGGFTPPGAASVPDRIEASYLQQVNGLPLETQTLLLVAAAEPLGDPALLWRATGELEIPAEAAAPAEADDLIEVGASVIFRHPLLRSAIYANASPAERRRVHGALADATDPQVDPDRRAWHHAQAALAVDEDVAVELESSAGRAQTHGGLAASAAFLERAAALTPDPARRAERRLAAARAKRLAGLPDAASTLLADATHAPLSDLDGAALQRLRGQIALDLSRGADAAPLLLDAARRFEPLDAALARDTHLESLWAATLAGRPGSGVLEAAKAARSAPPAPGAQRATDLLVDGLAIRFTDGYAAGVPMLKQALSVLDDAPGRVEDDVLWLWTATRIAAELFEDDRWNRLATRNIQSARDAGALSVLPVSLNFLAALRTFEGSLAAAEHLLDEADSITDAAGKARLVVGRLLLEAYRGRVSAAETIIGDERERLAAGGGEDLVLSFIEYARAILHNSMGHYEAALEAAQRASNDENELSVASWSLPEVIEAAVRVGRPALAADAVERLAERARATGTNLALGLEARSRALISEGAGAEELYVDAIDLLDRTRVRLHRARAQLVYGEWLRRENRRVDARRQLREAHDTFASAGAEAFAERACRELLATGETVRKRTDETRGDLTAQEAQIARLAAEGHTNPEIGAQLFLSPRTVEWHLRKVFGKLSINSRRELVGALPTVDRAA